MAKSRNDNRQITDLDIQALVDGAVDIPREKELCNIIAANKPLQARYGQLIEQKALLLAWWKGFGRH